MVNRQFQCELSWSASRAKEWERCRRENWYARYGSWGWWTEQPRGEKYEIMVHKCLTTLPAFTGNCMHLALERWFQHQRDGTTVTSTELYNQAVELFRKGWRQSVGEGWKARPNKSTHLLDHHYNTSIPKERTEAARALLERCAKYFVESPDLDSVRAADPEHWRSLETMDTYLFLGTKIYAIPDFVYSDGATVHIWDWKTGKPRDADLFQLHTYALYTREKWSTDPEQIVLHAAYIGEEHVVTTPVDMNRLAATEDAISDSLREMMEAHYDPDVDDLILENWPPSPEPHKCSCCRFRTLCPEACT